MNTSQEQAKVRPLNQLSQERRQRLHRALFYAALACLIMTAIAGFTYYKARIHTTQVLHFDFQILDNDTKQPIPGAQVRLNSTQSLTSSNGWASLEATFNAIEIWNRSAQCILTGTIKAEAAGFDAWQKELTALFGSRHDYLHKGIRLTNAVYLSKKRS